MAETSTNRKILGFEFWILSVTEFAQVLWYQLSRKTDKKCKQPLGNEDTITHTNRHIKFSKPLTNILCVWTGIHFTLAHAGDLKNVISH